MEGSGGHSSLLLTTVFRINYCNYADFSRRINFFRVTQSTFGLAAADRNIKVIIRSKNTGGRNVQLWRRFQRVVYGNSA